MKTNHFFITTPIYYVNDRPHIGHVYTTTIADILARYHRQQGEDVFFLTGTDEHAAKVVDSAREHNLSALEWADQNAVAFAETFRKLGMSHDDFVRTTQDRHKSKVQEYVAALIKTGDVYQGEYEGWYDAGQEEYVTDKKAEEQAFKSSINGKPLVRKKEKNYFFRLSKYQEALLKLLSEGVEFAVFPLARRNETINRVKEGLNDVPISRSGQNGWGIPIPGDNEQTIYVWIDALFNYLSMVDTAERRVYWPANVHLIAKDILWFHAVIWPAMLLALGRPLPRQVYAHSFWIAEGQKMSKSLGNFVDLEKIDRYVAQFGLDALRYFLAASGPLGVNDSDFAESKFIDVYNKDLANDYGNLLNRVSGLIGKLFGGVIPEVGNPSPEELQIQQSARETVEKVQQCFNLCAVNDAVANAIALVAQVNKYMENRAPWKVAKTDLAQAGSILYCVAEALRLATVMLSPVMPTKTREALNILGAEGSGFFWGELKAGTTLKSHGPLFPRFEADGSPAKMKEK